jgi:hypothetical protein
MPWPLRALSRFASGICRKCCSYPLSTGCCPYPADREDGHRHPLFLIRHKSGLAGVAGLMPLSASTVGDLRAIAATRQLSLAR